MEMLRVALASALLFEGGSLRIGARQPEPLLLGKKAIGPERRGCRRRETNRSQVPAEPCSGTVYGRNSECERVIGGTVVHDPGEYPFLAWLGDYDGTMLSQFCAGTLIASNIVLTAGHCLYEADEPNTLLYARFGLLDYAETMGIARRVINWKRHPSYSRVTLFEDLTVMMLNDSVPIQPVRLSDGTKAYEDAGAKTIVGWGSIDESCAAYGTMLRTATVPMGTPGTACSTPGSKVLEETNDFDPKRQCCAGDYSGHMRYPGCGDSGGPLLASDNGEYVQVGVVSWSYGIPYPDVFTRVSNYRDWIGRTIGELLAEGGRSEVLSKLG